MNTETISMTGKDAEVVATIVLKKLINDRISRASSGANAVALEKVTFAKIKEVEAFDATTEAAAIVVLNAMPDMKKHMTKFFKEVHELRKSYTQQTTKARAEF